MKHIFYHIGLFLALFYLTPEAGQTSSTDSVFAVSREQECVQETMSNREQQLGELSAASQKSQALAPRRMLSSTGHTLLLRHTRTLGKNLHLLYVQPINQLQRLSQHRNQTYCDRLSSLAFCEGKQLFALRKLLI